MTATRIIDDHLELANIGTNSHAQIDTHIAAADDYVKRDGSLALTSDWDIGDTRKVLADEIRARDGAGLKLYDDGGNGVFVEDGGNVGIGTSAPTEKLEIDHGNLRMNFEEAPDAPSVGVNAAAGNLNGDYRYKITLVTAEGETNAGFRSLEVSPANEQVDLSNIPIGSANVTARKIYRTLAGGEWPYFCQLVTTISDNTTTTYTDNIADGSLGVYVPENNTTGANIYCNAVNGMESGMNATRLGYNAGRVNKGIINTFLGLNAGYNNTIGYYNVFLGGSTGYSNTTGSYNTFVGQNSGYANTTGNRNMFLGQNTGAANTTGSRNTYIGFFSGSFNTTGGNNTGIGSYSGRYQADGSSLLTDAEKSVYIGYETRGYDNSDTNAIVIGYTAIGIGANSVVLGNDNITKTALKGDVGLGTTSPTAKLDVNSDILRLRTAKTPASAGAAGNTGDMGADANYIYRCVSTNSWKRAALNVW